MELNIDLRGNQLVSSRDAIAGLSRLNLGQATRGVACDLWLLERAGGGAGGSVSAPFLPTTIPAPYDRILVVARTAINLEESSWLFAVLSTTAVGTGDTAHYTGVLTVDTAEVAAKFTAGNEKTKTLDALVDILLVNADDTHELPLVLQLPCTIYRSLYTGDELPAAVIPAQRRIGSAAIPNGQSYVDVVFDPAFPDNNWFPLSLSVQNLTDPTPQNMWTGLMTVKTAAGFRVQLNGDTDTANYLLRYACES